MTTVNSHTAYATSKIQFTAISDRQPVVMLYDAQTWRVLYSDGSIDHAARDYQPKPEILPSVNVESLSPANRIDILIAYVNLDNGHISNLDGMLQSYENAGAIVRRPHLQQIEHDLAIAKTNYLAAWKAQEETTVEEGAPAELAEFSKQHALECERIYRDLISQWTAAKYPKTAQQEICEEKLALTFADETEPDYSGSDDLHNSLDWPY